MLVLDGEDRDIRASRANYGIVWVQGKGLGLPPYQRWTRLSSDTWPAFAAAIEAESDVAIDYERPGGLTFCLGADEFDERSAQVRTMREELGEAEPDTCMLDRRDLQHMLPGTLLGPRVSGAVFCWRDAHVNPLLLLKALQVAIVRNGGRILTGRPVDGLIARNGSFTAVTGSDRHRGKQVVIAAGTAAPGIARHVGLNVPVRPQRGQILVTERLAPILPMPTVPIRQTAEGTVLIGSTQEEVGFDTGATGEAAARMAARAIEILPALRDAVVVRQWAGLRVMSPDVAPIYVQSERHPGAWAATCHSGVTLAAAHALHLAPAIAQGVLPDELSFFHPRRFDVSQAA